MSAENDNASTFGQRLLDVFSANHRNPSSELLIGSAQGDGHLDARAKKISEAALCDTIDGRCVELFSQRSPNVRRCATSVSPKQDIRYACKRIGDPKGGPGKNPDETAAELEPKPSAEVGDFSN